ncbi:MAG: hypothetical protein SGPRY_003911 [Prymnesium sp.]
MDSLNFVAEHAAVVDAYIAVADQHIVEAAGQAAEAMLLKLRRLLPTLRRLLPIIRAEAGAHTAQTMVAAAHTVQMTEQFFEAYIPTA